MGMSILSLSSCILEGDNLFHGYTDLKEFFLLVSLQLPSSDRCVVLFIHPTSVADWLLWARCWALWAPETALPTRSCCSDKGPHMASALEGSLRESGMGMERGPSLGSHFYLGGRRGILESVMLELGLERGEGMEQVGRGSWPKTLHPEQALE